MSWRLKTRHSQFSGIRGRRTAVFETLEQRMLLAGDISLVRYFETWNADPQIVRSTDLAGITYHEPSGHLYLVDSEIDEIPEIFNGDNVFEVSLRGDEAYRTIASNNKEPTGITYNAFDGFFYVTNDGNRKLTRYDDRLNTPLASVDTRDAVASADDPEDVAADPDTGLLYVVDGIDGGNQVLVYDSSLSFQYSFPVSDMTDPEGIALHPTLKHLFLVSARGKKIVEYTLDGTPVEEYDYSGISPAPAYASGLTFAPTSNPDDAPAALSLYVSDRGRDNYPDGGVFEVSITAVRPPLIVQGTAEGDVFEFHAGTTSGQPLLKLNGVELPIPAGSYSIEFHGGDGDDQVWFDGSDGEDTALLRPNAAVVHSGAYTVSASQVETIHFDGAGGMDVARLYGSSRTDTLTAGGAGADPKQTTLCGGFSLTAIVETLYADGRHGRNTATLPDSQSDAVQQFWKWAETRHDPDPEIVGDESFRFLRNFWDFSSEAAAPSEPIGGATALLIDAAVQDATPPLLVPRSPESFALPDDLLWLATTGQTAAENRTSGTTDNEGNRIDDIFALWE